MEIENEKKLEETNIISNRRGEVAVRSDSLIEARYRLSARANDIVDMVTVELKNDKNLTYEIALNNYSEYVINKENVYRDFKKVVNAFKGKGVYVKEDADDDSEAYYPWFSKIKYIEGKILVDLHPDMKNLLLTARRGIYYDIKYSINLTNEYAKKYYYCCKLFATSNKDKKSGFRIDKVEELQEKLEVPKSYKDSFYLFENHVLKVAEEQINEFSDINIKYEVIRKGKRPINIYTKIWVKDKEKLEEVSAKTLNVKKESSEKIDTNVPIRLQVLNLLSTYDEVIKKGLESKPKSIENKSFVEVKEMAAEALGMTIKNINRYIYINYKLIEEFVDMYDKGFITLGQAEKFARLPISKQKTELKTFKLNIEKFKKYLIDEMIDLLKDYKISYNIAEKYSKVSEEEQKEYYNKFFNKPCIIDTEYKEVKNNNYLDLIKSKDISSESNNGVKISDNIDNGGLDYIQIVKNVIKSCINIDISDEEAISFYSCAKEHNIYGSEPIPLIREVAEYSIKQNINKNLISWFQSTLKNYRRPIIKEAQKPKLRFDNFTGRDYDYDALEKKLLGWDDEE